MNKPNLYLDVDGVLLLTCNVKPFEKVNKMLLKMLLHKGFRQQFNEIYWLSCWTKTGSTKQLYEDYPEFKKLKATALVWDNYKTDAIDWSKKFMWFEDGVLDEEREVFNEKAVMGQVICEFWDGSSQELSRSI